MQRSSTILLLALAGLLAWQAPALAAERTEDLELLIISTASNRGETEPCG